MVDSVLILYLMYNTKRSYFWKRGGGEERRPAAYQRTNIARIAIVLMSITQTKRGIRPPR